MPRSTIDLVEDLLGLLPGSHKEIFVTQLLAFLLRTDRAFRSFFVRSFLLLKVNSDQYEVEAEDPIETAEGADHGPKPEGGRIDLTFIPKHDTANLPYIGIECKIGAHFQKGQLDRYADKLVKRQQRGQPQLFAITREVYDLEKLGRKGERAAVKRATLRLLEKDGAGLGQKGNRRGMRTWDRLFDAIGRKKINGLTRSGLNHIEEVTRMESFKGFNIRDGELSMPDLVQARILLLRIAREVARAEVKETSFYLRKLRYKPNSGRAYEYDCLYTWTRWKDHRVYFSVSQYPRVRAPKQVQLEIQYWLGKREEKRLRVLSYRLDDPQSRLSEKSKKVENYVANMIRNIQYWLRAQGWKKPRKTWGNFESVLPA